MDADELMLSFFNLKSTKIEAPKPQNEVQVKVEEKKTLDYKREDVGDNYSRRYRVKEENLLATQSLNIPTTSIVVESNSDDEGMKIKKEDQELPELTVFQRFNFDFNPQKLPILEKRSRILKTIDRNQVIVLTASTGTGKSSQVPQYILEEARKLRVNCNIVVTQPRKIAAITIAKRVALERRCDVGTLVGYQVGLDKQMDTQSNSDTRILFCTTGVLLQKLINEKTMKRYTHVILDEVHERDVEMDLLLIVVRRLLATRNPYVKIILMSATFNADKLSEFFKITDQRGNYGPAPKIDLNIPRPFPVRITYLDSLDHLGASREIINYERPGISNQMYKVAMKSMELVIRKSQGRLNSSFLVFLPGIQEINRFKSLLYEPNETLNISKFSLSILHSSVPIEDYSIAFDGLMDNKIILATNIAESSITLPGVHFVIDFCLTKYLLADTATNMTQLKLDWASKMSLEQRAGRVGRIEAGQVIRLIYQNQLNELPVETIPEIKRASLESVVLKTKRLEMGKPSNILGLALDPPDKRAIQDSILVLKEIGGLTRLSSHGKFDVNDGELTFAGLIMAKLPVDIKISKLIILGFMFSCLEECIIIGAGMSSKSIFKNFPSDQKLEEFHQKLEHAKGSASDSIAVLNAYKSWRTEIEKGRLRASERQWCESFMLSLKNLNDMHELVEDIKNRLRHFRIEIENNREFNDNFELLKEKIFTIKICLAGAFYPHYFAFGGSPPSRDDYGVLNNMNPCTTVYLKGLESNRIGQLYEQQIREKLHREGRGGVTDELNEMKVKFDTNSARCHVEFQPISNDGFDLVPGEVHLEVYKAVKLRKLEINFQIKVMSIQSELNFAVETGIGSYNLGKFEPKKKILKASSHCIYPKYSHRQIPGKVTHIVNCGKFFFQPEKGRKNVAKQLKIFEDSCINISSFDDVAEGYLLILKHDGIFKRGKIIKLSQGGEEEHSVYLIDYGAIVNGVFSDFYTCNGKIALQFAFELPPQCYQCQLSEIRPSPINCPTGWSVKSTEEFHKFIEGKGLEIEVLSFVDRVASVRLFAGGVAESFNDYLRVPLELAQLSDDSYIRLMNQIYRESQQGRKVNEFEEMVDEMADESTIPPPKDLLRYEKLIQGSFSPLESKIEGLFQARELLTVIEVSSVNHVLFDPHPNDGVKKLLVAASMSERNGRVTLHQTTILPQLPGIACLLGLIFSPNVEVRCTGEKNRYTSILTGLGCDENQKSHFGEHDCMFFTDIKLNQNDFWMINTLREKMSFLMRVKQGNIHSQINYDQKSLREEISCLLNEIMTKDRYPLGLNMEESNWNWNSFVKIEQEDEAMYPPLVNWETLVPMSESTRRDLKNHAAELKRQAETNSRDQIIRCQLCDDQVETVIELKLHVMTQMHQKRIDRIRDENF